MARKFTVGTQIYESSSTRKVTAQNTIIEETESAVSGNVIEIPTGNYQYIGIVPTVEISNDIVIEVPTGSYQYIGQVPTVLAEIDIVIEIPTGNYQYTGSVPNILVSGDFNRFFSLPKNYRAGYRAGTGIQPTGPVEIDWSNPLTKNMVGVWLTNGFNRELVQNQFMPITGTDFTIKRDRLGSRVDFGNTQTTWFEVPIEKSQSYLIGTKDFSWAGLVDVQAAPSSEQTLFQIGRGQTGGRRFSIFLNTTEVWDGEIDDDTFRSDFNFTSAPPLNERSTLLITADRDSLVRGYLNGVLDGTADISNSQGSLDDPDHGVHIGYNQELNVGSRDNISRSGFEMNVLWHRLLSDAEIQSFNRDPYQILKPLNDSFSFASTPDIEIEVPTGSYVYTGIVPELNTTITVPTTNYQYTGQVPIVDNPVVIEVPTASYTYTGQTPSLSLSITVPTGQYTYNGIAPSLNTTVIIPTGTYQYVGQIPTIINPVNITVPTGNYQYTGIAPNVILGNDIVIEVPTGSFNYLGQTPDVTLSTIIEIPTGDYQYIGQIPTIDNPNTIEIPTGNYQFNGEIPIIDITGLDVSIEIPPGNYQFNGNIPLIYFSQTIPTPASRTFTIEAENRTFTITA